MTDRRHTNNRKKRLSSDQNRRPITTRSQGRGTNSRRVRRKTGGPPQRNRPGNPPKNDRSPNLSRRRILKAGGAVALAGGGVLAAAGKGGKQSWAGGGGHGPCDCPDGTRLVAKYEFEDFDDDGEHEAVFEKGDTAMSPENDFVVDPILDGDGEAESFFWNSYPYTITHIVVKAGQDCETIAVDPYSGSHSIDNPIMSGTITPSNGKAVSHVLFCAPIYYQIDTGNNDLPWIAGTNTGFLEAIVGASPVSLPETDQNGVLRTSGPQSVKNDWFYQYSGIQADLVAGTASVDFKVKSPPDKGSQGAGDGHFALVAMEAPSHIPAWPGPGTGFRNDNLARQVQVAADHEQYDNGDIGKEDSLSITFRTL